MAKFKVEIEVLKQKVYLTVETTSKINAQVMAYDKIRKCKKEVTKVEEL